MDKSLLECVKNMRSACAIIKTSDATKLNHALAINANVSDNFLYAQTPPPFAAKIDEKSKKSETCYLIVADIDKLSLDDQNRYAHLVKSRKIFGYTLPQNCVIIFTVKNKDSVNKLSPDILQLSIVSI